VTYLVDTDWVADWLHGRQEAIDLLAVLQQDGLAVSLITYGEIYEGIYYSRDPSGTSRDFSAFFALSMCSRSTAQFCGVSLTSEETCVELANQLATLTSSSPPPHCTMT